MLRTRANKARHDPTRHERPDPNQSPTKRTRQSCCPKASTRLGFCRTCSRRERIRMACASRGEMGNGQRASASLWEGQCKQGNIGMLWLLISHRLHISAAKRACIKRTPGRQTNRTRERAKERESFAKTNYVWVSVITNAADKATDLCASVCSGVVCARGCCCSWLSLACHTHTHTEADTHKSGWQLGWHN